MPEDYQQRQLRASSDPYWSHQSPFAQQSFRRQFALDLDTSFFRCDTSAGVEEDESRQEHGPCGVRTVSVLEQSVGGPERGEIVVRTLEVLIKGKNTGIREIDVLVEYVRCCWDRGSRFGGMGGQKMWNFHYLLLFTKRSAQSFCKDPKFKAILQRPKYKQDVGHGKITDEDVDADECDDLVTSAFLEIFMKKVERLEETQWKKGESGSKETKWGKGQSGSMQTQWGKGQSGSKQTQWGKGQSGSKATQWKAGESGSKTTQWVSCGRFGVKGKAETYASMNALVKAIGRISIQSNMSKALKLAKQKTPSSALCVDFKCSGLELFWDKENGVGESAVEEEEEEVAP